MPGWFVDTSALAKLYHTERGTEKVELIAETAGNRLWISRLGAVELSSVLAKKARTGLISRDDVAVLLRRFSGDLTSRRLEVYAIHAAEFAVAEGLIRRHGFEIGLRSLDAIQIAAAVGLRNEGLVEYVVASDRILCRIAALEGFSVLNPEDA